jgi:hypothetical protein
MEFRAAICAHHLSSGLWVVGRPADCGTSHRPGYRPVYLFRLATRFQIPRR